RSDRDWSSDVCSSDLGATVSVPAFLVAERVIVLPAFSPLALGVDVASYPYLSPILNGIDVDEARVIGIDEKGGLLEFGRVAGLQIGRASCRGRVWRSG